MTDINRKPVFDLVGQWIGGWDRRKIGQMDAAIDAALGKVVEKKPRSLSTPDPFWSVVREDLFDGTLTQSQKDGIDHKLNAFGAAGWSAAYAAYAFATSYWETKKQMQPVEEGYYLGGERAKRHQHSLRYYPWFGRGDVQLTWERNYRKADAALGLGGKLIADPSMALDPEISARIMVWGMENAGFTKYDLADFFPDETGTRKQHKQARRIINGTDKWNEIADIALIFQRAIVGGSWS